MAKRGRAGAALATAAIGSFVAGTVGTIGITDYAQQQLGDVVFVELPDVGRTLERGKFDASKLRAVVLGRRQRSVLRSVSREGCTRLGSPFIFG